MRTFCVIWMFLHLIAIAITCLGMALVPEKTTAIDYILIALNCFGGAIWTTRLERLNQAKPK